MNKKVKITLAISFLIVFVLSAFLIYRQLIPKPEIGEDIWAYISASSYEPRGVLQTVYRFEVDTNGVMKIYSGKRNGNAVMTDEKTRTILLSKSKYEKLQSLAQKVYDYPLESGMINVDPAPDSGWEFYGTIHDRSWVECLYQKKRYAPFGNNELFLDFVKEVAKYGRIKVINRYIP